MVENEKTGIDKISCPICGEENAIREKSNNPVAFTYKISGCKCGSYIVAVCSDVEFGWLFEQIQNDDLGAELRSVQEAKKTALFTKQGNESWDTTIDRLFSSGEYRIIRVPI